MIPERTPADRATIKKNYPGWHEVVSAGNIKEVKYWQQELVKYGAPTKIVRGAEHGRFGVMRIFLLLTDEKGMKLFDMGRHVNVKNRSYNQRVKWDSWGYECYNNYIGYEE